MKPSPPRNRLANETSPYLLQHATNPVDWYAWGQEAFEQARRHNKPIFLSVGYSTCYWCHVMERESFENEATAQEMNRAFVCIKVDREERPDVDQLYMTAVQMMTHSGGWPMNLVLTPDLRPFFGGTYFPPQDLPGRPGFPRVLHFLEEAWTQRPEEVESAAASLLEALRKYARATGAESPLTIDSQWIDQAIARAIADYDQTNGGFGAAPKFPRQTLLELLLAYCDAEPSASTSPAIGPIKRMLEHTLDAMAKGGIRDQLAGGFHRYSTDAHWLIPHFEIMLYDNAMLLVIYAWAARLLRRPDFARVAEGIADFVLREMTGEKGEFHTALDAEVDGREGASYLWSSDEISALLPLEQAALACRVFGLDEGPNFADPHHGAAQPETNVLYLAHPLEESAKALNIQTSDLPSAFDQIRQALLKARNQRRQPMRDTKVITSWAAMMARAFAFAGRELSRPDYIHAAECGIRFLTTHHRMPDGGFFRTSRDGAAKIPGFLDDYASLAQAMLELWRATGQPDWKTQATAIFQQALRRFSSDSGACYFTDAGANDLPVRQMLATDSPLPAGNALMAICSMDLEQAATSRSIVAAFADSLDTHAESMPSLLMATLLYVRRHGPIVLTPATAGEPQHPQATSPLTMDVENLNDTHLRLTLHIAPGFHIGAATVASGLYPTQVSLWRDGKSLAIDANFPPATHELHLADGATTGVYEGDVVIDLGTNEPHVGATVHLSAQPCTESACLEVLRLQTPVPGSH